MHTCGGILELVAGLHGLGLISERGTERERERERRRETPGMDADQNASMPGRCNNNQNIDNFLVPLFLGPTKCLCLFIFIVFRPSIRHISLLSSFKREEEEERRRKKRKEEEDEEEKRSQVTLAPAAMGGPSLAGECLPRVRSIRSSRSSRRKEDKKTGSENALPLCGRRRRRPRHSCLCFFWQC